MILKIYGPYHLFNNWKSRWSGPHVKHHFITQRIHKYHDRYLNICRTVNLMADFWIHLEQCAYQSLKKMRGNNEKGGWAAGATQVDRGAAWHRRSYWWWSKYFVSKSRWQSDLVSLRSSKHQSEAGQIKDPTMRSSMMMMMIEPKHLIFRPTKFLH